MRRGGGATKRRQKIAHVMRIQKGERVKSRLDPIGARIEDTSKCGKLKGVPQISQVVAMTVCVCLRLSAAKKVQKLCAPAGSVRDPRSFSMQTS